MTETCSACGYVFRCAPDGPVHCPQCGAELLANDDEPPATIDALAYISESRGTPC